MRVFHILPGIATLSAGPSYTVPTLSRYLNSAGIHSEVLTVEPCVLIDPSVRVFKRTRFGLTGQSYEMLRWFWSLARHSSTEKIIIHSHSIWLPPNLYPFLFSFPDNVRRIISPRGTLSKAALSYSKIKKKIVWASIQKSAFLKADAIHATSELEAQEVAERGRSNNVFVIPNGVDLPDQGLLKKVGRRRRIIYLSRIHPKKGIHLLLESWLSLGHKIEGWELLVVGPLDDYAMRLRESYARPSKDSIIFYGEAHGDERFRLLSESSLFILPTLSENFGVAIAEAMACRLPVIVGRGAPWPAIERYGLGWWIAPDVEAIRNALLGAMACSERELHSMGERGRAHVEKHFNWTHIADEMLTEYKKLFI